ncbi:NDR1/HIN1-like protein 2 [Phragmites australis]|uniref:NDR1/HIN1-like protein 2 n=1 Tax=Phragmites australis TaxID=29695 RepID=UPI002D794C6E|nr:NDR1/HIN1-like protein 2 [Phragmites australis]
MGSGSRAVSCLCCPCKCLACGLFSCLCSILISLLVTVGVLVLILYFVFRPHMIAATVDSASLAQFSLAPNSALAYNLTVAMTVRNPNKRVGLYYDSVESLALFQDQRFGYTQLDSFYQGTEASTKLTPEFHGQEPLQGDVTAANFRKEQSDGKFNVDVKLNAKLRVKVWTFKVPGPKAKVTCPLSIPAPGSNTGATFQPTDCKVWF